LWQALHKIREQTEKDAFYNDPSKANMIKMARLMKSETMTSLSESEICSLHMTVRLLEQSYELN